MAFYFRHIPNIDYISRGEDQNIISAYATTKNLFKRGKIRDDIFGSLTFFNKYSIIGDERPDNVAFKVYNDETLDWVVLLSNNILNVYDEWPMAQEAFDKYLLEKYGSYQKIYENRHWETVEIKNRFGNVILKPGLVVPYNYTIKYFDDGLGQEVIPPDIVTPVTNYEYEMNLENKKREIFLLKPPYIPVIVNDIEKMMPYKEGGEQYVNPTLKRVDNIRLYEK